MAGGERAEIERFVGEYYGARIREHGPTHRGVDWSSEESQRLRFEQLTRLVDSSSHFSIADVGCGYGGLALYLRERGFAFKYTGCDLAPEMVAAARDALRDCADCRVVGSMAELEPADYIVASGIFNVRGSIGDEAWTAYVDDVIAQMAALGRRGFAFNVLTKYSDADRMRPDLFYADPCRFFDLCKRRYSRNVALPHDYELYEFTILVRR